MANIPRILARGIGSKSSITEWIFSGIILLIAFGMLFGIVWWIPTVIGYPFYVLYTKLMYLTLSPSESFWVTVAMIFFVWLLAWLLRQIRNLFD